LKLFKSLLLVMKCLMKVLVIIFLIGIILDQENKDIFKNFLNKII
jgi:hypothetical protein